MRKSRKFVGLLVVLSGLFLSSQTLACGCYSTKSDGSCCPKYKTHKTHNHNHYKARYSCGGYTGCGHCGYTGCGYSSCGGCNTCGYNGYGGYYKYYGYDGYYYDGYYY